MKINAPPEQEASPSGLPPDPNNGGSASGKQETRRRVLGMALGAPLIYTIPNGAAMARSSNACDGEDSIYTMNSGDDLPAGYRVLGEPDGAGNQLIATSACLASMGLASAKSFTDLA